MTPVDFVVVLLYLAATAYFAKLGSYADRGKSKPSPFTADSTSWCTVALSVAATSISGATFVGVPAAAYDGNLTYAAALVATIFSSAAAAVLFLQQFVAQGYSTVYQYVEDSCGSTAQRIVSLAFIAGRCVASSARIYIAALPISVIMFGSLSQPSLVAAVLLVGIVACIYTLHGGISAVLQTDRFQFFLLTASAIACILYAALANTSLPSSVARIRSERPECLEVFDTSFSLTEPFNLWSCITGVMCFGLASYAVDQDLAQRFLLLKRKSDVMKAAVFGSSLAMIAGVLFLLWGFLLMAYDVSCSNIKTDSRRVVVDFVLLQVAPGLRGLCIASLCAAAMSSLDSAINALSISYCVDLRGRTISSIATKEATFVTLVASITLIGMAVGYALVDAGREGGILQLALGCMVYSYSGLLSVFIGLRLVVCGNATGVILGLIAAPASIGKCSAYFGVPVSYGWLMLLGTCFGTIAAIVGFKIFPSQVPKGCHARRGVR